MDYLVAEVLQRQPERVRSFLLQTSILDRLSGPLCDAVTGQQDGLALLDALERGNLFVVPLDDSRLVSLPPSLCRRAGCSCAAGAASAGAALASAGQRWYVANGFPADAIRHALAAKDFAVRRGWSSWPGRPWTGGSRPLRGWAGRRRSPTSWSAPGPCSALPMPGRC